MKRFVKLGSTLCIAATMAFMARAGDSLPGQIDFGKFTAAEAGAEFVEVNLSSNLISLAARLVEKEEADVAELLRGLHLVHVNVLGMDEGNRDAIEKRAQKVRKQLENGAWERVVTVQKDGQDLGVYLKTGSKQEVEGLTVVVLDGKKHAVFVNIVGNIKPEQLSLLGDKLHIDPLKKIGKGF